MNMDVDPTPGVMAQKCIAIPLQHACILYFLYGYGLGHTGHIGQVHRVP